MRHPLYPIALGIALGLAFIVFMLAVGYIAGAL